MLKSSLCSIIHLGWLWDFGNVTVIVSITDTLTWINPFPQENNYLLHIIIKHYKDNSLSSAKKFSMKYFENQEKLKYIKQKIYKLVNIYTIYIIVWQEKRDIGVIKHTTRKGCWHMKKPLKPFPVSPFHPLQRWMPTRNNPGTIPI